MKPDKVLDCYFRIASYMSDQSLFIALWSHTEGPLLNLTVCLCDPDLAPDESYVDINNFPKVLEMIADLELGTPTGKMKKSGYVTYPVVKFNMEELNKPFTAIVLGKEDKTCI